MFYVALCVERLLPAFQLSRAVGVAGFNVDRTAFDGLDILVSAVPNETLVRYIPSSASARCFFDYLDVFVAH